MIRMTITSSVTTLCYASNVPWLHFWEFARCFILSIKYISIDQMWSRFQIVDPIHGRRIVLLCNFFTCLCILYAFIYFTGGCPNCKVSDVGWFVTSLLSLLPSRHVTSLYYSIIVTSVVLHTCHAWSRCCWLPHIHARPLCHSKSQCAVNIETIGCQQMMTCLLMSLNVRQMYCPAVCH